LTVTRHLAPALLLLTLIAAGCGDDDTTGPGPNGPNAMSATIDGQPWVADPSLITVTSNSNTARQGTLLITGGRISTGEAVTLTLSFVSGSGTYPLGVNFLTNAGGHGQVVDVPDSWNTPLNGAAGTVNITTRTSTRIAGSFSFTAKAVTGGTTPETRIVTGGSFDITVSGGLPALPTGLPSSVSATIDGAFWNAATVEGESSGSDDFTFAAFTNEGTVYSVTLSPTVPVTAGVIAYGIPSQMSLTITRTGTSDTWRATAGPDIGSVTITAFSGNRVMGTFSGTIPPFSGGASTALEVTGGVFDVDLE
jgi:hypothetical protein